MVPNKKVLAVFVLFACAFVLLGADTQFISSDEAQSLVKSGALLLDVRTAAEFSSGHLDGAVNIAVQDLEAKLAEVPAKKDQPIVVYCKSGRRSEQAKGILEKAGFTKVKNLGPMSNWK